ncbi:hypothetical protein UA08_06043 [Talaromyces atroroseus]|uniref:ABC transporter domain-containing protein n=1 Tax=Talaromyces atroroseus TaxID=1441469 RepID=A0A225AYY2_TALAT|nr:hypothetical protein UA08_06043 [Talaromyces atroroseus]OKL58717.1 hypothetical protein UA08_06043 [Talaromyces atroroseus]
MSSSHSCVNDVIFGRLEMETFAPQYLSPVASYGVFIATGQKSDDGLSMTRAFLSLSLLALISTPFSMFFQLVPLMIGARRCLKRVEKFLELSPQHDSRVFLHINKTVQQFKTSNIVADFPRVGDSFELRNRKTGISTFSETNSENYDSVVHKATLAWPDHDPILQNVDIKIPKSKLSIVIGPNASGKTTLCKALLCEAQIVSGSVHVGTSPDIAVCNQQAFLFNASVRENITAFSSYGASWYNSTITAVGLEDDIKGLPDGDDTLVGSNGISLSGGQKQRVAMARAVYARKKIILFDDVFSGMDSSAEKLIFEKPFGAGFFQWQITLLLSRMARFTRGLTMIYIQDQIIFDLSWRKSMIVYSPCQKSKDLHQNQSCEIERRSSKSDSAFNSAHNPGDLTVYKFYIDAVGTRNIIILFILAISLSFFTSFPSVWLTWWTDAEVQGPVHNGKYFGIYAALQALGWLSVAAFFYHTVERIADMQLIDGELPRAFMNLIMSVATAIGQVIHIALAAPFAAISFPFIIAVFIAVQRFYLRTSKRLRLLDLETRSPLYTHFLETVAGISTIRPFGWRVACMDRCYQRLDSSQRPFYLLFMIQQWLFFVLDIITAILAVVVVTLAFKVKSNSGFMGAGLVNLISFNATLRSIIFCWSLSETSIGGVSRVRELEYSITPEERLDEKELPPTNWPTHGKLEIMNLTASYHLNTGVDILKNVNMVIQPGETLEVIESLGGLEAEMKPDLLSHGQKQLFALARALLHPEKRILLMDEPTSSLDSEIDAMVQNVIRQRFQNHTIIAISHWIESILGFDRVAVFREGELVEFDAPTVLMKREASFFKELCVARGPKQLRI